MSARETETRETVCWECVGRAAHFLEDRPDITVSQIKIQFHRKGKKLTGNGEGQHGQHFTIILLCVNS